VFRILDKKTEIWVLPISVFFYDKSIKNAYMLACTDPKGKGEEL